jgi:hypothetical protein
MTHHPLPCPPLPFSPFSLLRHLPSVNWNIDSFGHTTGNSGVVAGLAYSSQVLNRVPHRAKSSLRQHGPHTFAYRPERTSRRFELVTGLQGRTNASTLTTSVLPFHYSSPGSMDQSLHSPHLSRSQRDSLQLSLLHTVSALMTDCSWGRDPQPTACDLMLLVGNDLTYAGYASTAYRHLDTFIRAVNQMDDPEPLSASTSTSPSLRGAIDRHRFRLRLFYSTPTRFFTEKRDQLERAAAAAAAPAGAGLGPVEGRGHFVPYSDSLLNDWTGYYGSRPLLKEKIRSSSSLLLPPSPSSFLFLPPSPSSTCPHHCLPSTADTWRPHSAESRPSRSVSSSRRLLDPNSVPLPFTPPCPRSTRELPSRPITTPSQGRVSEECWRSMTVS